jgi:hypothetical protein
MINRVRNTVRNTPLFNRLYIVGGVVIVVLGLLNPAYVILG